MSSLKIRSSQGNSPLIALWRWKGRIASVGVSSSELKIRSVASLVEESIKTNNLKLSSILCNGEVKAGEGVFFEKLRYVQFLLASQGVDEGDKPVADPQNGNEMP